VPVDDVFFTDRERHRTFKASKQVVEDVKKAAEVLSKSVKTSPTSPKANWPWKGSPGSGIVSPAVRSRSMQGDGVLIDGRNRLAACKLANVKPVFAELPKDALCAEAPVRYRTACGVLQKSAQRFSYVESRFWRIPEMNPEPSHLRSAAKIGC
jgi:hypothetical protein